MIEAAFTAGILPQQMYDMALWEFNACLKAYNKRREAQDRIDISRCWQMAAFTGAAFAGKLKRLSHYVKDDDKKAVQATKLTPEQMKVIDERFKEKGSGGGNNVA